MRACDMVTLIKLSKAVWTRAIYKAVFKKKSPCRSRKDGWTLLPDPQVWRRHTGLMHDVIYLTCSPLYFDQTFLLFHIFMVLCTLACCKRCQCTEPREVSGVIAWLHLLQCFLSTSLLGDTRWGQSAMVSCQKRALVLSCTWLERDMMLGKRKSAGSHISSNIPACSFLCRKPTRLPDIGQCKKTLPSEFLITVLLMTAVVGNTHVFSTAREQLTKTKRLHARARPFSEITARSPTVEALASRYL